MLLHKETKRQRVTKTTKSSPRPRAAPALERGLGAPVSSEQERFGGKKAVICLGRQTDFKLRKKDMLWSA